VSFTPITILQASAQAVDFKSVVILARDRVPNPRDLLQLVKELLCSSFVIGELSTEQELAQFDLIE